METELETNDDLDTLKEMDDKKKRVSQGVPYVNVGGEEVGVGVDVVSVFVCEIMECVGRRNNWEILGPNCTD